MSRTSRRDPLFRIGLLPRRISLFLFLLLFYFFDDDCNGFNHNRMLEVESGQLNFVNFTVIPGRNNITITAWKTAPIYSDEIIFGCIAYKDRDNPPSLNYMRVNSIQRLLSITPSSLIIENLESAQDYHIYCLTFDYFNDITTSYHQMVNTMIATRTLCCRPILVSVHSTIISLGKPNIDIVEIVWDYFQDSKIAIEFQTRYRSFNSSSLVSKSPFHSSFLNLTSAPFTRFTLSALSNISPGEYELVFLLTGVDSSKYEIVYLNTNSFVTLTESQVLNSSLISFYETIPLVSECRYTSQDQYLLITFNTSTNMAPVGLLNVRFNCSLLLSDDFEIIHFYFCIWNRYDELRLYPLSHHPNYRFTIGSTLYLTSNNLKSFSSLSCDPYCSHPGSIMRRTIEFESLFSSSPSHSFSIQSTKSIILPKISITSPSVIGPYDDYILDLTQSTGHLNHVWLNYTIITSSIPSTHSTSVLAVNQFFEKNYSIYSPTSISSNLLTPQVTYLFKVHLCNYLHFCSLRYFSLSISNQPIPVIYFYSSKYFLHNPKSELKLETHIYLRNATSTQGTEKLNITWSYRKDDEVDFIQSNSSRSDIFLLSSPSSSSSSSLSSVSSSFSREGEREFFEPDTVYEILVTVIDPSNPSIQSNSSGFVYIKPGKLIPLIKESPYHFSLPTNRSKTLNASLSYDENVNQTLNYQTQTLFSWHCSQIFPVVPTSNDCGLTFSSFNSSVIVIKGSRDQSTAVNYTSRITLSLSDKQHSRLSFISFLVDIIPSTQVEAVISTEKTHYSSHNKIFLEGKISSTNSQQLAQRIRWTVSPILPTSSNISAMIGNNLMVNQNLDHPLNLKQNTLTSFNSYLFQLSSSEGSYSSVYISIVAAPIPGNFSIYPSFGEAYITKFHLSTQLWSDFDDNLPLEYEFGYQSPNRMNYLVTHWKSFENRVYSYLPAGSEISFHLNCFVRGSNIYGATRNLTKVIQVSSINSPVSWNISRYSSLIQDVSSNTNIGHLSSGVTYLNTINHSCSYNCANLNRYPCLSSQQLSHTCGKCLAGYVADDFVIESNTRCYSLLTVAETSSCSSTSPVCEESFSCDLTSGQCVPPQKPCPNNCSHRGSCVYLSRITKEILSECNVFDTTCEATCHCESNYSKIDCFLSTADLNLKTISRNILITDLLKILLNDNFIEQNIHVYISLLDELIQFQDELSSDSCSILLEILFELSKEILTLSSLPYEEFIQFSEILHACSTFLPFKTWSSFLQYLELLADHMLPFEESIEIIKPFFRFKIDNQQLLSIPPELPLIYRIPQTTTENLFSTSPIIVSLNPSNASSSSPFSSLKSSNAIILTQYHLFSTPLLQQYSSIGKFLTHPLSILISATDFSRTTLLVNFTRSVPINEYDLNHLNKIHLGHGPDEEEQEEQDEEEIFTTTCEKSQSTTTYICRNKFIISHSCNGVYTGSLVTHCPARTSVPLCGVIKRNEDNTWNILENGCQPIFFDDQTLTCQCHLNSTFIEIIPYELYVYDSTTTTALEFNHEHIDSVLVMILFMFLWFTILMIGFVCHYVDSPTKSYTVSNISTNTAPSTSHQRRRGRKSCPSGSLAAYAYVLKYIDKTIPYVFRPKKPLSKHISFAIFQHHRYMRIFTTSSGGHSGHRILQVFHFLTVQSVFLFTLLLILDYQYPSRSEISCQDYTTQHQCNQHKSVFDDDVPICRWRVVNETENLYYCHQSSLHFTGEVFFVVVVILAFLGGFINLLIDPLFWILRCPVESKLQKIVDATHPKAPRRRRTQQVSAMFKRAVSERIQNTSQYFYFDNFLELFYKSEQVITLSSRLVNWHDLIVPSLAKLESDLDFHEKFSFVNQRGAHSTIDTKGLLFTSRSQKQTIPLVSSSNGNNSTIHHFMHQLKLQHSHLTGEKRKIFEDSWSLSPFTGSFSENTTRCHCLTRETVEQTIFKKIDQTNKESIQKCQQLKYATDAQKGVQLIHLFIMDMLDRDSLESKIFRAKIEADFSYTCIITNLTQKLVILFIILLNIALIVVTISYAVKRDYSWQKVYVFLYIWGLFFEFVGFEPAECIWIHYILPTLIQTDVEEAVRVLYRAVDFAFSNLALDNIILDVPNYFFLSTQVAKDYQDLFESSLILSFQTYMGLRIVKNFKDGSKRLMESQSYFDKSFDCLASLLPYLSPRNILLFTSNMPLSCRKYLFHSITPLFLICLLLLIRKIYHHPVYLLVPVILSILIFCLSVRLRKHLLTKKKLKVSALAEIEATHKRIDPLQSVDTPHDIPNKVSDKTMASTDSIMNGIVMRSPRKYSNETSPQPPSSSSSSSMKPESDNLDERSDQMKRKNDLITKQNEDLIIQDCSDDCHASDEIRVQSPTSQMDIAVPLGYGLNQMKIGHSNTQRDLKISESNAEIVMERSNSSPRGAGSGVGNGSGSGVGVGVDVGDSPLEITTERPSLVSYELGMSGKQIDYTLPENSRLRTSSEIDQQQIIATQGSDSPHKREKPNYRGAFSFHETEYENDEDNNNNTINSSTSRRRRRSIQRKLSKKMSGTVKKLFSRVISTQFSLGPADGSSDEYDSSDFSDSRFSFDSDDDEDEDGDYFSNDELDVINIDKKITQPKRQFPSSP